MRRDSYQANIPDLSQLKRRSQEEKHLAVS